MARKRSLLGEDIKEIFQRNGRLLTGFAVFLILAVGITLIENPGKWWVSFLAIAAFFLVFFLFFNSRVVIKSIAAIIIVLLMGTYSFQLGVAADPTGTTGSLWLSTTFATFFFNLSFSYLKPSNRGRWGVAILTSIGQFLLSSWLIFMFAPPIPSLLASALLSIAFFIFVYKFSFGTRMHLSDMPVAGFDEESAEMLKESALSQGWGAWVKEYKGRYSVIVWNDKTGYNLIAVDIEEKLSVKGNRKTALHYNGKPVRNWLLDLAYRITPMRGTGNADLMIVLLDRNNGNGNTARVIGVKVPDSKRKIPVGILPSGRFLQSRNHKKMFKTLQDEFDEYPLELTSKQLVYLDSHLPDEPDKTLVSAQNDSE